MVSQQFSEAVRKIDELDFTMLKSKLCLPPDRGGKGWSVKWADECELWYKRFLKLKIIGGKTKLVPTKEIDDFWHAHILDTFRYHEDCQNIFGSYLHHFPYFGLRGDDDAKEMRKAHIHTMDLFGKHFHNRPPLAVTQPGCGTDPSCGVECA